MLAQPQRSSASPVVRHRSNHRYHCRDAIGLRVSTSVSHIQSIYLSQLQHKKLLISNVVTKTYYAFDLINTLS